jgi:hypothetical protein
MGLENVFLVPHEVAATIDNLQFECRKGSALHEV